MLYTDFTNDMDKMRDFYKLSKEEFLQSYSYLDEKEYDLTAEKVSNMQNKVVLYGETSAEITDMLTERVRCAADDEKQKAENIFLNWINFVNSLESDGSLCGLVTSK